MLKQLLRRIRRRPNRCDFEFVPEGWRRAQQAGSIKGWNVESVVETQRARWDLGWRLNRNEFLEAAQGLGAHQTREFVLEPPCLVPGSPEAYQTRGFLFDLTGGRA